MGENTGERMFRDYAAQEGYPDPRALEPGPDRTPDFELATTGGAVICEVKHFPWTEGDAAQAQRGVVVGWGQPGFQRLRDAIRRAKAQLKRFSGEKTVAVMCATNPFVNTDGFAMYEAMFGSLSMRFTVDPEGQAGGESLGTFSSGHGRIVHPEHPAPWVSAVAVLEQHQPDRRRFEELVGQRLNTSDKPGIADWLDRWEAAAQAVRGEHPELDPERVVLRMRVFENPEAEQPLPRTILAGQSDVRYGSAAGGRYGPLTEEAA